MLILGIDPGMSGGFAGGDEHRCFWVQKMPETELDIANLIEFWCSDHPSSEMHAYIENVHSMPKQGVSSTFKFGRNYGFLRGCLTAFYIPFTMVSPQKWQSVMGCRSKGDKNVTKARAQQLFPDLAVTHATADALLICEYGRREIASRFLQSAKSATKAGAVHPKGRGD